MLTRAPPQSLDVRVGPCARHPSAFVPLEWSAAQTLPATRLSSKPAAPQTGTCTHAPTQALQLARAQTAALVAARPAALLARLVPPLDPLGGAQRAVRARERAALLLVAARLRHAAVVLLVARVAVARLRQHAGVPVSARYALPSAGRALHRERTTHTTRQTTAGYTCLQVRDFSKHTQDRTS